MEIRVQKVPVRERVKLFAYEDEQLARPVYIDLICSGHAEDLEELAGLLNLRDLIHAVREAEEKLPRGRTSAPVPEPGKPGPVSPDLRVDAAALTTSEGLLFDLPAELLNKRYIFPFHIQRLLRVRLCKEGDTDVLRGVLFGSGEGMAFERLGLLGRAADAEHQGPNTPPFFYATLIQFMGHLADLLFKEVVTDNKVKELSDALRTEIRARFQKPVFEVHRSVLVERILDNPLAPYALRRQGGLLPAADAALRYLAYPNAYGLTPELYQSFDRYFDGRSETLGEDESAYEGLRVRIREAVEAFETVKQVRDHNLGVMRLTFWSAVAGFLVMAGILLLPSLAAAPVSFRTVLSRLSLPEMRGPIAMAWQGGLLMAGSILGLGLLYRMVYWWSTVPYQIYRHHLTQMKRLVGFRESVARALAFFKLTRAIRRIKPEYLNVSLEDIAAFIKYQKDVSRRIQRLLWKCRYARSVSRHLLLKELPRLLTGYLKLKMDELDHKKLRRVVLPAVDYSDLYQPSELRQKWEQNSCVCYGDNFDTLISGETKVAAVYFIDVLGSTELSTRQNLSNALELYSRLLRRVNETGTVPMWRKEVGDGRIYCHTPFEALSRSIMTVQGCLHPKIGLEAGIGLSVGEIYTDVSTGDFVNETTNRASRLNARDEVVGEYLKTRYIQDPFKVHVKYGRLYNKGIALDEKALIALGIPVPEGTTAAPPYEIRFPVKAVPGAAENAESVWATVSFYAERSDPESFAAYFEALEGAEDLKKHFARNRDTALYFQVFCHLPKGSFDYRSPLKEGQNVKDFISLQGGQDAHYGAGESERTVTARSAVIPLSDRQTITILLKEDRAYLKGLGNTIVAEAEVPKMMMMDHEIRLEEFLSSI